MKIFFLIIVFAFQQPLQAQISVPTAEEIMTESFRKASTENKNVFLIFHASWCTWCKRMDKIMSDSSCKSFFDNNYIITHLVADEATDMKNLENKGFDDIRKKYGGDKKNGLPLWFILDKKGNLIADSKIRSADSSKKDIVIGCPYQPDEVTYFMSVLKKTGTWPSGSESLIQSLFLKKFNGIL